MITCLLVDDELNCLDMLEWLLQRYTPQMQVLGKFQSGAEATAALGKLRPDIVFLDIEMPHMNGFDFLEQVPKLDFDIVFTTAYNKFALKAFKYSALNYLLKPIDPEDLVKTVERVKDKIATPSMEQIQVLMEGLRNERKATPERVALSTGDGLVFVRTEDILYCQAESNYTRVALKSGQKLLISKTLKDIDDTLSLQDFFRVHNSFLININQIVKFVRGDGGYILMPDDMHITISRSRREEFFDMFDKF